MLAKRGQCSPVGFSEIVADNHSQIERFGDGLDATDEVDCGADHGEIETIRGADIAVNDRAVMEGDDDFER